MRAGIILQARMASRRLPGKALESIAGRSILEHCLARLAASDTAPVVLATTDRPEDDVLESVARRAGADVFRGHADDVLDRYVRCAYRFHFDLIVRATADNPAVDLLAPGRVLSSLCSSGAQYVHEYGLPYGAAVEAVTHDALLTAAMLAREDYDREHVTTFIRRRSDLFRQVQLNAPAELARPDIRVTVDTPQDLQYVRSLFAGACSGLPDLRELISVADRMSVPGFGEADRSVA